MNLTTPAAKIVLEPHPSAPDPAAVAADLRALADLVEDNAHLAAMITQLFDRSSMWPIQAMAYDAREDPRMVMAETIRQLKSIATGRVEKCYDDGYFRAFVPLGAVTLRLVDERDQVCTRVVTGTETVTEEIPDPEYIAAAPKIIQTREVEQVEWRCESLMGSK